jgi:hypothetical protein
MLAKKTAKDFYNGIRKMTPEALGKVAMDAYGSIPIGTPFHEIRCIVGQAILDQLKDGEGKETRLSALRDAMTAIEVASGITDAWANVNDLIIHTESSQ